MRKISLTGNQVTLTPPTVRPWSVNRKPSGPALGSEEVTMSNAVVPASTGARRPCGIPAKTTPKQPDEAAAAASASPGDDSGGGEDSTGGDDASAAAPGGELRPLAPSSPPWNTAASVPAAAITAAMPVRTPG